MVAEQCWVLHANTVSDNFVPRELQGLGQMPVAAVAFKLRGGRSHNSNMKLGRVEPSTGTNLTKCYVSALI